MAATSHLGPSLPCSPFRTRHGTRTARNRFRAKTRNYMPPVSSLVCNASRHLAAGSISSISTLKAWISLGKPLLQLHRFPEVSIGFPISLHSVLNTSSHLQANLRLKRGCPSVLMILTLRAIASLPQRAQLNVAGLPVERTNTLSHLAVESRDRSR